MDLFEAIEKRRAVKHYDPDHDLGDGELRDLLSAAALAPSAFNIQNRHFVAVVDPEIKARLQAAAWGQEQIRDASIVVVITGDLKAHRRTERTLRSAPAPVREKLEPMVARWRPASSTC